MVCWPMISTLAGISRAVRPSRLALPATPLLLSGFGAGSVTLLAHGLLADDLDAGRHLTRGEAEPAGAARHHIAVERRRCGFGDRERLCRRIPRGAPDALRRGLLRAALACRSLRLRRRHHDGAECR